MKITYETHFSSKREDGRYTSTLAAFSERLRNTEMTLAIPEKLDEQSLYVWRETLKNTLRDNLRLDFFEKEAIGQPAPKMLTSVKRDGYTAEKWELYPDAYSAVPFLALIPDGASSKHPVPAVMCFPGSTASKEFLANEPLIDTPACRMMKYPERNKMAYYIVKNGMAAFVFDNPETAECAIEIERDGDFGMTSRQRLCYGLLQSGLSYFGLSTAQKLIALSFIRTLPFIDTENLAISAHSLGCDDAMHVALLNDDIKAVVFNDFVCDERHRYYATTEYDEENMNDDIGSWHIVPNTFMHYQRPQLLAALAPRWLALNEGGAEYYIDMIRRTYSATGHPERLQITHYPKYAAPESRSNRYQPPSAGLSFDTYFEYTNTDARDHSYREVPSIALLKKAFRL